MAWYFSNATKGFYNDDLHPTDANRPSDAVEVSEAIRNKLLSASREGKGISLNKKGEPVFSEHSLPEEERWKINQQSAQMALAESADMVMRFYEKGEAVPKEVVAYRDALRKIISDPNGKPGALPAAPSLN